MDCEPILNDSRRIRSGSVPPSLSISRAGAEEEPFYSPISANSARGTDSADLFRMKQSAKCCITFVFWYKRNCDPIRRYQEIPTFPFFNLSCHRPLIDDYDALRPTSYRYVEFYNPAARAWEQTLPEFTRCLTNERVLYRCRYSRLEDLSDAECPGLLHEISLQYPVPHAQEELTVQRSAPEQVVAANKRISPTASTFLDSRPPKYARTDSSSQKYLSVPPVPFLNEGPFPHNSSSSGTSPAASLRHKRSVSSNFSADSYPPLPSPTEHHSYGTPAAHPARIAALINAHHSAIARDPTPFDPPTKPWPNGCTVGQIVGGFLEMDALCQGKQPKVNQRAAFTQVFGCRYVKSTVCRHRSVWRHAIALKMLEGLGSGGESVGGLGAERWSAFAKRVEGRYGQVRGSRVGTETEEDAEGDDEETDLEQYASGDLETEMLQFLAQLEQRAMDVDNIDPALRMPSYDPVFGPSESSAWSSDAEMSYDNTHHV